MDRTTRLISCIPTSLSLKSEVERLKGYILYALLLREWPLKDFGHFIDHFGSYSGQFEESYESHYDYRGSIGINDITYNTLAKSLFDIEDFDVGVRLWWLPKAERLNLTEANITNLEQNNIHVYPLPAWLAHLFIPGNVTDNELKSVIANPIFIENLTRSQLFKMFKFGLWSEYRSNRSNKTLSDVLKEELEVFEDNGFDLRFEFQVTNFVLLEVME